MKTFNGLVARCLDKYRRRYMSRHRWAKSQVGTQSIAVCTQCGERRRSVVRPRIGEFDVSQILTRYEEGDKLEATAAEFGVSVSGVSRLAERHGLPRRVDHHLKSKKKEEMEARLHRMRRRELCKWLRSPASAVDNGRSPA